MIGSAQWYTLYRWYVYSLSLLQVSFRKFTLTLFAIVTQLASTIKHYTTDSLYWGVPTLCSWICAKTFFFSLQSLSFCLDNSLAGDQESSKLPTWACPLKYKLFQVRSALVIGAYVCTILIFYCWPLDLLSDCLFHTVGTSKEEQRGHV